MVKTRNIDIDALNDAIKESGIKSQKFADTLGITRQSFNNKRNGKTQFKLSETFVMGVLLGLNDEQKNAIFFPENVK